MATVELIPFTPGRRPTDEARHAWLGSSDQVAFVLGDSSVDNRCYLLLAINGTGALDVTLKGVPGWERRPFEPAAFVAGETTPRPWPLGDDRPYVITLLPDELDLEIPFAGLRLEVASALRRGDAPRTGRCSSTTYGSSGRSTPRRRARRHAGHRAPAGRASRTPTTRGSRCW